MKKLLTFLFAVALSMVTFASECVVMDTLDFNGTGTVSSGSPVEYVKSPVTFSCNKAYGDNFSLRCYKGAVITVKVDDGILDSVIYTYNSYTKTTNLTPTVVNSGEWTYTCEAQARIESAAIYYTLDAEPPVSTAIESTIPYSYDTYYNIYGMKVSDSYRGIVIQNGHKYLK